jgi:hypothetical protein
VSDPRFDLKVPNALPQLVVDRHLCSPSHRRSVEYAGLNHVMVGNANVEVEEARSAGQPKLGTWESKAMGSRDEGVEVFTTFARAGLPRPAVHFSTGVHNRADMIE